MLLTALLWSGTDNNIAPYFSIYVYANETDSVELRINQERSAVSNIVTEDHPQFNSSVITGQTKEEKPRFSVLVLLNDQTKNYESLFIYYDGEKIEPGFLGEVFVAYMVDRESGEEGICISGTAEETSTVEVVLQDEGGVVLQRYSMVVTPMENGYNVELDEAYVCESR